MIFVFHNEMYFDIHIVQCRIHLFGLFSQGNTHILWKAIFQSKHAKTFLILNIERSTEYIYTRRCCFTID
jgi:hypothetical protein